MPLSRTQTRTFVAVLVALMLGLSILAAVLIRRGWNNRTLQQQVEQQESERRSQMPRLDGGRVAPVADSTASGG